VRCPEAAAFLPPKREAGWSTDSCDIFSVGPNAEATTWRHDPVDVFESEQEVVVVVRSEDFTHCSNVPKISTMNDEIASSDTGISTVPVRLALPSDSDNFRKDFCEVSCIGTRGK
jgi:hypothetical protein